MELCWLDQRECGGVSKGQFWVVGGFPPRLELELGDWRPMHLPNAKHSRTKDTNQAQVPAVPLACTSLLRWSLNRRSAPSFSSWTVGDRLRNKGVLGL